MASIVVLGTAEPITNSQAMTPHHSSLSMLDHLTVAKRDKDRPTKHRFKLPRAIIDYANDVSGYATGNIVTGETFVQSGMQAQDVRGRTWYYGKIIHPTYPSDNECGWVRKKLVRDPSNGIRLKFKKNACADKKDWLSNRYNIGKDFNCKPHQCDDGSFETDLKEECYGEPLISLGYNQRQGRSYGKLAVYKDQNQTGGLEYGVPAVRILGNFKYRFTTPDGTKAVGRATLLLPVSKNKFKKSDIWATAPESCIQGERYSGPPNQDYQAGNGAQS